MNLAIFCWRNVNVAARVPPPASVTKGGVALGPFRIAMLDPVAELIASLRGSPLSRRDRWLLRFAGSKLCYVACLAGCDDPVAVAMFYVNRRDMAEATIHLGFIGVAPHVQGRGLAHTLLIYAFSNFGELGTVTGVSSRVSMENSASMRLHRGLGFRIVERYFDKQENADRFYLVCNLGPQ